VRWLPPPPPQLSEWVSRERKIKIKNTTRICSFPWWFNSVKHLCNEITVNPKKLQPPSFLSLPTKSRNLWYAKAWYNFLFYFVESSVTHQLESAIFPSVYALEAYARTMKSLLWNVFHKLSMFIVVDLLHGQSNLFFVYSIIGECAWHKL